MTLLSLVIKKFLMVIKYKSNQFFKIKNKNNNKWKNSKMLKINNKSKKKMKRNSSKILINQKNVLILP